MVVGLGVMVGTDEGICDGSDVVGEKLGESLGAMDGLMVNSSGSDSTVRSTRDGSLMRVP
jgi:hypothetical protein